MTVQRVTRYEIRDVDGHLVAVHCREDGPEGKRMWWARPDGTLGLGGISTADLPLYGAHRLKDRPGERVVLVEGEKSADYLTNVGMLAGGTVTGSGGTPSPDSLRPLVGREVLLWPDADEPGRAHMERIAARLVELGITPRLLEWSDAPPGGDGADFIDQHGEWAALDQLIAAARPWTPEHDAPGVVLADVQPETVRWLWPSRVPLGKLTVLDGDPGLGKSLLAIDISARVSTGQPMPDGSNGDLGGPRGVVVLTAEDDLADTVRPRLDAAGGDPARVLALPVVRREDGTEAMPTIEDLAAIEAAVRRVDAVLVVVDPLMAYLPDARDSHRDQDIRRALAPLAALAAQRGVAILVVRHLNKGGGGNPLYRGGGSIGIVGAARSGLLVASDPDDPDGVRRILVPTKANLSAPGPAMAYTIQAPDGVARIVWLGLSNHTAEALLAARLPDEERTALEAAEQFLHEVLTDGPVPAKQVQAEARDAGIAERTLWRAKGAVGVVARKGGFTGGWLWELPAPKAAKTPPSLPTPESGSLRPPWQPSEMKAPAEGAVDGPMRPTTQEDVERILGPVEVVEEVPVTPNHTGHGKGREVPQGPCPACGGGRFWRSAHGLLTCATCHPPAARALVDAWIVRRKGHGLRLQPHARWRVADPEAALAQGAPKGPRRGPIPPGGESRLAGGGGADACP